MSLMKKVSSCKTKIVSKKIFSFAFKKLLKSSINTNPKWALKQPRYNLTDDCIEKY